MRTTHIRTRPGVVTLLLALAIAAGVAEVHPRAVQASTSTTPYVPTRVESSAPQTGERWGERLVAASLAGPLGGRPVTPGDLDGDGVNDFFVATPFGNGGQGRVSAVSGRTLNPLYAVGPPEPQAGARFGFYISVPGDLNGDGKPGLVSGTDAQDVGSNNDQGQAWVFDGATGTLEQLATMLLERETLRESELEPFAGRVVPATSGSSPPAERRPAVGR